MPIHQQLINYLDEFIFKYFISNSIDRAHINVISTKHLKVYNILQLNNNETLIHTMALCTTIVNQTSDKKSNV